MHSQTLRPATAQVSSAPPISALIDRYRLVRAASLALTAPLSPEDLMVQSCAEASPAKWHLAHTSWFFETFVLRDFLAGYQDFHPDFHWLFNSYYNSLGDMPAKIAPRQLLPPAARRHPRLPRPRRRRHRPPARIPARVPRQRRGRPPHRPRPRARAAAPGAHRHRHQARPLHQPPPPRLPRTLRHRLRRSHRPAARLGRLRPRPHPDRLRAPIPTPTRLLLLRQRDPPPHRLPRALLPRHPPRHLRRVPRLHGRQRLHPPRALALRRLDHHARREAWQAPLYWQRDPATHSGWRIYTLHGWQPLDDLSETPVCHLSFFEADAYARWAARHTPGARLPTEFEWEFAATQLGAHQSEPSSRPDAAAPAAGAERPRISAPATSSNPAHLHPTRASALPGLQQIFGDVWEWTSSAYTGYPGYRPLPGALGEYNGKFMSSQMVLRGGSCVTPATHIRATYRNFFSPSHPLAVLRPPPRPRPAAVHQSAPRTATYLFSREGKPSGIDRVRTRRQRSRRRGSLSRPHRHAQDPRPLALLRRSRLAPLRADHRPPRVLPHPHRTLDSSPPTPTKSSQSLGASPNLGALSQIRQAALRLTWEYHSPSPNSAPAPPPKPASSSAPSPAASPPSSTSPSTSAPPPSTKPVRQSSRPSPASSSARSSQTTSPTPSTSRANPAAKVLALYIGSSIGNFAPAEARAILTRLRAQLQPGDALLLGVDLAPSSTKSVATLLAAYDDAAGVTAAFNRNILTRLNRELGADFRLDRFAHRALWNPTHSRIEMHLESQTRQTVHISALSEESAGLTLHFAPGETIHTENSYKFTRSAIDALLTASGFTSTRTFTDPQDLFAVTLAMAS